VLTMSPTTPVANMHKNLSRRHLYFIGFMLGSFFLLWTPLRNLINFSLTHGYGSHIVLIGPASVTPGSVLFCFCETRRLHFAILTIACIMQTVSCHGRAPGSSASVQTVATPRGREATAAAAEPKVIPCPPAGSHLAAFVTGHHKVILSWKASVPSIHQEDSAVGYCLYRSTTKNVADKNATKEFRCSGCEQINFIPVASTGCIDNLVQDATTYYYVATAISRGETLSTASNETSAEIPPGPQSINPSIVSSYSLCREPAGSK
jgi:hypothetical protein